MRFLRQNRTLTLRSRQCSFAIIVMLTLLSVVFCLLGSIGVYADSGDLPEPEYHEFSDLAGKRVAMMTGAPFEEAVSSREPNVGEFQYFTSMPDMKLALVGGKIDAYIMNNAVGTLASNMDPRVTLFPEPLGEMPYGLAFKKGDPDCAVWNAAYQNIDQSVIDAVWDKWTGSDESVKVLPAQDWPGTNGTVVVAACDTLMPMSYSGENGQLIGMEEEVVLLIAKELDYHVEFQGMEFSAVMPTVQSGKAKIGIGSILVNDERREIVDFIEYYPGSIVLMVRSAEQQTAEQATFLDALKGSLERTFVTDNRYQLILSGLLVTVVVAVLSGAFGTLLGFGLVLVRRKNHPVLNKIIDIYGSLINGIPVVVILMVLYYIIFGAVDAPAAAVAVIGFTLVFGSRSFATIWNAVKAVDGGQMEAALALGYSEKLAFRRVILPQAKGVYMAPLRTQLVALLKETSIAGYITVLDLTRAGDIIRGRTLEAFFPLIAIAAIYFLLTWLFTRLLTALIHAIEKKEESRIIKGVD